MVIGETEMRGNSKCELTEGLFVYELTPVEGVDVHIAIVTS